MMILLWAVTFTLSVLCLIALTNVWAMPRLVSPPAVLTLPNVSVLIPARNEAQAIGATVHSLLAQSVANLELLVLDDGSTDGTAESALAASAGDPRCRVLPGRPLPVGWLGKNWACHQLSQAARHEILLFCDADVQWQPGALAAVMGQLEQSGGHLLTIWPTQITVTWGERLVVPLMALAVLAYLPIPFMHQTPWPLAAAAVGQCLVFRRAAYHACGGHQAVRNQVLEDVLLARRIKAAGLRLRMADGAGLLCCRMYRGWCEVRMGYGKNILAGHGQSLVLLLLSTFWHWTLFVAPWLWLAMGWTWPRLPGWPLWPLVLTGLGVGVRALTAWLTRQRLLDALLLPVSVLLMTVIGSQAIWWRLGKKGPAWKGRVLRNA
jgi:chlorobactene glucosyltransferase